MPAPVDASLLEPVEASMTVALEPAQNAFNSLHLLLAAHKLSGLGEWVTSTRAALSESEFETHRLIFNGLYHATLPQHSWTSFTAYIDHLESQPPAHLRDKLLRAYARMSPFDYEQATASIDAYLEMIYERFPKDKIDQELESRAFSYIADPARMQELIATHLRSMWNRYLEPEWNRVLPLLENAVQAFQQVDLNHMDRLAAAQLVTDRIPEDEESQEWWHKRLTKTDFVVFVPSTHIGPYLWSICGSSGTRVIFGARLPDGSLFHAPELSRNEIVVRLNSLADDTRLAILKLIADAGELCSQDIMTLLDLSQSAASRHLTQLSATGYLAERRHNSAKCYTLNPQRIKNTLRSVSAFLLNGYQQNGTR